MIAYKVVLRRRDNRKISAVMSKRMNYNGYAQVQYIKGVPTIPNPGCGSLCAFYYFHDALNFLQVEKEARAKTERYVKEEPGKLELWEAEIVRAYVPSSELSTPERLITLNILPQGTVLCSSITLIRKIENEKCL